MPSEWLSYVGVAIKILSGLTAFLSYLANGTMTAESATGTFGLFAIGSGIDGMGKARQATLIKGIALQEKVPVAVVKDVLSVKK